MYEISLSLSAPSSAIGHHDAAAEEEEVAGACMYFCAIARIVVVELQHLLDQARQAHAARRGARGAAPASSVPRAMPELQREQVERDDLGGERLGAGDADLGAGVRVEHVVALARDRRVAHVADREHARALRLALAQRGERVGRLAGLRDRDHEHALGRGSARGSGTRSRDRRRTGCRASCSIRYLPTRHACQAVPQATSAMRVGSLGDRARSRGRCRRGRGRPRPRARACRSCR